MAESGCVTVVDDELFLEEIVKVIDADECGPTGEPAGIFRDGKWCALWAVCPEDIVEFQPLFTSA